MNNKIVDNSVEHKRHDTTMKNLQLCVTLWASAESSIPLRVISRHKLFKLQSKVTAHQTHGFKKNRPWTWTPHITRDQPFCCLKDWMEPEWCTIATVARFPAAPKSRVCTNTNATHTRESVSEQCCCSLSLLSATTCHGRRAFHSNTCLCSECRPLRLPPSSRPRSLSWWWTVGAVLTWTRPLASWFTGSK